MNCDIPEHKPKPRPSNWRNGYTRTVSYAERKRRRECVDAWVSEHGNVCPACGADTYYADGTPVEITADHSTPVALGGSEYGPLRPLCRRCQNRQAAQVARLRRRRPRG